MASNIFFTGVLILICFVSLSVTISFESSLSEILEDYKNHRPSNELESLTCGETVTDLTSQYFIHRQAEEIPDNERCVWIVAARGSRGYHVNIPYLGESVNSDPNGPELILTGVKYNRTSNSGSPILTSVLPTSTGYFGFNDSNIIVVTFTSKVSNGDAPIGGFVFSFNYTGFGYPTYIPSWNSTRHVLDIQNSTDFHYPTTADAYDSHELAIFVYPPANNIFTGKKHHIWYKENSVEDGCYDSLNVYKFNTNLPQDTSKWEESGTICGQVFTADIQHDDMIMLIFQTDESVNDSGFILSTFPC